MKALGLDKSSTTSTDSAYSQYNAVWNKLEQDCSDTQPESKYWYYALKVA
jgi:hypothetical protein